MKIAETWWIGIAFPYAAMTIVAPFLTGCLVSTREPWPTRRVTEAEKAALSRETGLSVPVGARFLLYGEDDGLDMHTVYRLRLAKNDLHRLLRQRPFQGAMWDHRIAETVSFPGWTEAVSFPGWNPVRRPKTRSTQVNFERKPGEGKATYLNITIDPNEDGTDDVYLELGYS